MVPSVSFAAADEDVDGNIFPKSKGQLEGLSVFKTTSFVLELHNIKGDNFFNQIGVCIPTKIS